MTMDQNPYAPPKAPLRDKSQTTIRWNKAVAVWWSLAWRASLYGLVGGLMLGAIGGGLAAIVGEPQKAGLYGSIAGYVAAIPASMLALKQALSKHLASLSALVNDTVA